MQNHQYVSSSEYTNNRKINWQSFKKQVEDDWPKAQQNSVSRPIAWEHFVTEGPNDWQQGKPQISKKKIAWQDFKKPEGAE